MPEYKMLLVAPEHLRPLVGTISFERTIEVEAGNLGATAIGMSKGAAAIWAGVEKALVDEGLTIPVPESFNTINEYRGYGSRGSSSRSSGKSGGGGGKRGTGLSKRQYARIAEALEEMHAGDTKWVASDEDPDRNPINDYLFGWGGSPKKYASKFPNPFNNGAEGIWLKKVKPDTEETDAFVAWVRTLAGLDLEDAEAALVSEYDVLQQGPASTAAESASANRKGVQADSGAEVPFNL